MSLLGRPLDLDEARHLFGRAGRFEVGVAEASGRSHTAIFADEFESAGVRDEVRALGERLVEHLSGMLFVLDPERGPLTADEVLERDADGAWTRAPSLRGRMVARTRLKGRLTAAGPHGQQRPPPLHGDLLADSLDDEPVGDVLEFLKGEPGWFELYKAFERMRDDAQRRAGCVWEDIGGLGWPPKREIAFFTESAQAHRHSRARRGRYDPSTAMPLDEARRVVARLARAWLAWRGAG